MNISSGVSIDCWGWDESDDELDDDDGSTPSSLVKR